MEYVGSGVTYNALPKFGGVPNRNREITEYAPGRVFYSTVDNIGNIKIDPINEIHKFGEYGILIGDKEYWGKGFAREASEEVLKETAANDDMSKRVFESFNKFRAQAIKWHDVSERAYLNARADS